MGKGLGEYMGDPRVYQTEPSVEDLQPSQPFQSTPRPARKSVGTQPGYSSAPVDERLLDFINTIPATIKKAVMTPVLVNAATPIRIDTGLAGRKDILIANMSDQVVWWNFISAVAVGSGLPLAANSVAGNFTGATFSGDFAPEVEFWAIAAAGAANLVVVIEGVR